MPSDIANEVKSGFFVGQMNEFFDHPLRKTARTAADAVILVYGVHLANEFYPRAADAMSKVSGMIVKRFNSGE